MRRLFMKKLDDINKERQDELFDFSEYFLDEVIDDEVNEPPRTSYVVDSIEDLKTLESDINKIPAWSGTVHIIDTNNFNGQKITLKNIDNVNVELYGDLEFDLYNVSAYCDIFDSCHGVARDSCITDEGSGAVETFNCDVWNIDQRMKKPELGLLKNAISAIAHTIDLEVNASSDTDQWDKLKEIKELLLLPSFNKELLLELMDCVYELFATPKKTPRINKLTDEFEYFLKVAEMVGKVWFAALKDPDNVPRLCKAVDALNDRNLDAIERFYKGVLEAHDSAQHADGYVPNANYAEIKSYIRKGDLWIGRNS
jgi:hypothetical protein